ncbi:19872_t:CDS:1, partial [Gigaspora margarita]
REEDNIEIKYGICNVTNKKSSKICNAQLKVSNGSTTILISHLLNIYGIMQNDFEQDNIGK